jgi:hypothetical protein
MAAPPPRTRQFPVDTLPASGLATYRRYTTLDSSGTAIANPVTATKIFSFLDGDVFLNIGVLSGSGSILCSYLQADGTTAVDGGAGETFNLNRHEGSIPIPGIGLSNALNLPRYVAVTVTGTISYSWSIDSMVSYYV